MTAVALLVFSPAGWWPLQTFWIMPAAYAAGVAVNVYLRRGGGR